MKKVHFSVVRQLILYCTEKGIGTIKLSIENKYFNSINNKNLCVSTFVSHSLFITIHKANVGSSTSVLSFK